MYHMHRGVEPESTQHFSTRTQPINHPHLDCSQPPSAITVVIRFNRSEMIAAKYLWWRTLWFFSATITYTLSPSHTVPVGTCSPGCALRCSRSLCSWDDLIHGRIDTAEYQKIPLADFIFDTRPHTTNRVPTAE